MLFRSISIDAENEDGHAALEIEDEEATPFDQLAASEIQAVIQKALESVPQQFRSAVVLRDLEGLSYEEVAEVLDISVGTVKSRILRGRRSLREILAPRLDHHRVAADSSSAAPVERVTERVITPAPHAPRYAFRESATPASVAFRAGSISARPAGVAAQRSRGGAR